MRTLGFLLQKEFRQIFRNPTLLRMILALPIVQLVVLPLAADYEIKNINIAVVDLDQSTYSQRLAEKITASGYFRLTGHGQSHEDAFQLLEKDEADLVLEIPADFEARLHRENAEQLFVAVNAINGTKANVGGAYLMRIISAFNQDIRVEWQSPERFNPAPQIEIASQNWFNFLNRD